jgi:hypothetical protein
MDLGGLITYFPTLIRFGIVMVALGIIMYAVYP